jgi:hypothetical protein
MKRLIAPLFAAAIVACAAVTVQAEDLKSGPAVGSFVNAFDVKDCTGPAQGKTLCYRCRYGDRPVIGIFTRSVNDELVSLIKQVDETVAKNDSQKLAAFVVLLTDDQAAGEKQLRVVAEKHGIANTPLTLFRDTKGPNGYNISPNAEVTVSMWTEGEVKAGRAFAKGQLNKQNVAEVLKDTAKILQ